MKKSYGVSHDLKSKEDVSGASFLRSTVPPVTGAVPPVCAIAVLTTNSVISAEITNSLNRIIVILQQLKRAAVL